MLFQKGILIWEGNANDDSVWLPEVKKDAQVEENR